MGFPTNAGITSTGKENLKIAYRFQRFSYHWGKRVALKAYY